MWEYEVVSAPDEWNLDRVRFTSESQLSMTEAIEVSPSSLTQRFGSASSRLQGIIERQQPAPGSSQIAKVAVTRRAVFGDFVSEPDAVHLSLPLDGIPVQYFVGRNGTAKSRTAKSIASALAEGGRLLSTDRLIGIMGIDRYSHIAAPSRFKGPPVDSSERDQILSEPQFKALGTSELYALRDDPVVLMRVAAFIQRTLKRRIEMRDTAGYVDPFVVTAQGEYSLLRDEGHGLRELVILLAAIYREDWAVLVVDEPELHLHPSMARLWLGELNRVCARTNRRAIVVSHEPAFLRPKSAEDLDAIWLFSAGEAPMRIGAAVLSSQRDAVTGSLNNNPQLISDLVYSPRPVLVEGVTDVAAFSTAVSRLSAPEVTAQTDFVSCGGRGGVAVWLDVSLRLGIDVRAVCDLDVLFAPDVQRTIDALPGFKTALYEEFRGTVGRVNDLVGTWIRDAKKAGRETTAKARADWLATQTEAGSSPASLSKAALLSLLAKHGLWIHPEGNLEAVLGIDTSRKDAAASRQAALVKCGLDAAATWAAFDPDPQGEIEVLLGMEAERVAHRILESLRADPGRRFTSPAGETGERDAQLFAIRPLPDGEHQLTVIAPLEFEGKTFTFSRSSASDDLVLSDPPSD